MVAGRLVLVAGPWARTGPVVVNPSCLALEAMAGAATVAATAGGVIRLGWVRYTVIAFLAFAMGVRNSTIRRLTVPDVTTTVLTMTLTGLAADPS